MPEEDLDETIKEVSGRLSFDVNLLDVLLGSEAVVKSSTKSHQ